MNLLKSLTSAAVISSVLTVSSLAFGADRDKAATTKPATPYPLQTCIVSGEKLDGAMGKPYVFVQEGQEFKLCCKSCLKDFQKDPAKYLKKLADSRKGKNDKGHDCCGAP